MYELFSFLTNIGVYKLKVDEFSNFMETIFCNVNRLILQGNWYDQELINYSPCHIEVPFFIFKSIWCWENIKCPTKINLEINESGTTILSWNGHKNVTNLPIYLFKKKKKKQDFTSDAGGCKFQAKFSSKYLPCSLNFSRLKCFKHTRKLSILSSVKKLLTSIFFT